MSMNISSIVFAAPFSGVLAVTSVAEPLRMVYDAPAGNWNEALPLGNGRLGAMVFGGPGMERIQLNEDTLWAGGPNYALEPRMRNILPILRKRILAGDAIGGFAFLVSAMVILVDVFCRVPGNARQSRVGRTNPVSRFCQLVLMIVPVVLAGVAVFPRARSGM